MEVVFWIGFAIAVGFWADSKGRNGFGWGLLSLVISPLLGAIILFFVSLKDQENAEAQKNAEKEAATAEERRLQAEAEAERRRTTIGANEFAAEIEKFFGLKENGLLTDQEFTERKQSLILALSTKKPRESSSDFLSTLISLVKRSALSPEEIAEIKKYVF
jgi:phosphate/sulfate permease